MTRESTCHNREATWHLIAALPSLLIISWHNFAGCGHTLAKHCSLVSAAAPSPGQEVTAKKLSCAVAIMPAG